MRHMCPLSNFLKKVHFGWFSLIIHNISDTDIVTVVEQTPQQLE